VGGIARQYTIRTVMVRRQIALLTDFGTRDHYVAAMKGVIASRCEAAIHDLTHDIEPYDVFAAAWYLRNCESVTPGIAGSSPVAPANSSD
jgi:S-adenosylmethionine hydrolase